jgi:pimeloyl-ACP methyl ester carboxylesterase
MPPSYRLANSDIFGYVMAMSRIDICGAELDCDWLGPSPAEAPTLVLLHEGLGSIALWKDVPQRLSEATGCGVLVYSRQGYGHSSPLTGPRPVGYMHREAREILPPLLDRFAVRHPVFIGHSDGASIALIFAGCFPEIPVGLVLEAPHVFVEDVTIAGIEAARTAYRATDLSTKLGRYHDDVDAVFWGWNDIWLDPEFRSWNIEEYLPAIPCPVLQIQGRDDQYATRAQLDAITAGVSGPVETVLLDGCAHSPHHEQPLATSEAISTFVTRLLASRGLREAS